MKYMIQAKTNGGWDEDAVGRDQDANTFQTKKEAESMIKELRKIGDDWDGEYRVVERK